MPHFIEKIQQKPEHVRRVIALAVTAALFLGVVALWASTSGVALFREGKQQEVKSSSPFSMIAETMRGVYDRTSKSVGALTKESRGGTGE